VKNKNSRTKFIFPMIILVMMLFFCFRTGIQKSVRFNFPMSHGFQETASALSNQVFSRQPTSLAETTSTGSVESRSIKILLDDFSQQPYQGESVYFFNRLEGDRGAINNAIVEWGNGQVTTTISPGNQWGGVWMSLNHPIREGLAINFSAILPGQILPAYQSRITAVNVRITRATAGRIFKLELKDGNNPFWSETVVLEGGKQEISFELPPLGNVNQFVWVLDHSTAGDYVVLEQVSFSAATPIADTATAAFVWSYGMLLNNWNPSTGLVRDKAKDASGEFDAIQATGCLAAATTSAEQLGVIGRDDAIQIVTRISDALLSKLPRSHGLWPHWVKASPTGEFTIVPNTEWSSVDTVIASIGLLEAQSGLEMDTSGTEQMLQAIEWKDLVTPKGISHGYTYTGELIPYTWDVFGGESWLVELAYASVTGEVGLITYDAPPTANGSGFIDELAWLFVPPPAWLDYWGTDWSSYRNKSVDNQLSYFPDHDPGACFIQLGLFGLSAGEIPYPSMVAKDSIYQAFGVGGRFASANDGSALLGAPVVIPHYSAMIAPLRSHEAIQMWKWLIDKGYFSPLNNVESIMFPDASQCEDTSVLWNQLKGSWNLSLQTLGWGSYLAEQSGQEPILWQAVTTNQLLRRGYLILAPNEIIPTPAFTPQADDASSKDYFWKNVGPAGESILALAVDPLTTTIIYAGTDSGGVFKSTDGGENWNTINTGLPKTHVNDIAINPLTPATLYVGTDSGLFRSSDAGASWSATGLSFAVYDLAIDPKTPSTFYGLSPYNIVKSTDEGRTWSKAVSGMENPPGISLNFHVAGLAIDPLKPTMLYAATTPYTHPMSMRYWPGYVFISTNSAVSWSVTDLWFYSDVYMLVIDPSTPSTLYLGLYTGVMKSTDSGKNWDLVNNGLEQPDIRTLAIDPANPAIVYAGTRRGVFVSTNGAGDWNEFDAGLPDSEIIDLAIDPKTPTTLYAATASGVFKNSNGGSMLLFP